MRKSRGANGAASSVMSDHHKHTEFLRHCIRYDDGARRQELMARIIQIQRDAKCVWRAVCLITLLVALGVFGFGYGWILVDNFPNDLPQFVTDAFCALGAGLLISLLAFVGLGMIYRLKLDRRREECREIVTRLLESRLGKPATAPLQALRDELLEREMAGPLVLPTEAIVPQ